MHYHGIIYSTMKKKEIILLSSLVGILMILLLVSFWKNEHTVIVTPTEITPHAVPAYVPQPCFNDQGLEVECKG